MHVAENPRLANDAVILEPLTHRWTEDLQEAVASQELWRHWFVALPTPDGMAEEIDRRDRARGRHDVLPHLRPAQ